MAANQSFEPTPQSGAAQLHRYVSGHRSTDQQINRHRQLGDGTDRVKSAGQT